jgi:hypothetical protein
MAMRFYINNGETVSPRMGWDYLGACISFLFFDAMGDPAIVTGTPSVEGSEYDTGDAWQPIYQFSRNEWRYNGPLSRVRVSLSGVTGYTTYQVVIWRTGMALPMTPDGAYAGLRAQCVQTYTEANVKNGVQYEVSVNVASLGVGAHQDTIFITGSRPVLIKNRIVQFNGVSLLTRVFRAPTYTGGSVVPYYNLDDISPVAGAVQIIGGATVTGTGTEFGAPTYSIGSTDVGNSSLSTFSTQGIERRLRPNTTYLQRITNDSPEAQRVTGYLTWYDGGSDLPLGV